MRTNRQYMLKNKYYKLNSNHLQVPVPRVYYNPHVCTLSRLKEVEWMYHGKWINKKLYDEWMSINGGDYQLGASGKLDYLWEDRYKAIDHKKIDIVYRDLYNNLEKNKILKDYVSLYKCKNHDYNKHVRVLPGVVKREQVKILNRLFPFSSSGDKDKTSVDVASYVTQMIYNGYLDIVNKVFEITPVGAYNCMVVFLLINAVGKPVVFKRISDMMYRDKACCLVEKKFHKYFKAVTVAIRRTFRWYDHVEASLDEVTSASYWYMSSGRSSMKSDWYQEKQNRIYTKLPLKTLECKDRNEKSNKKYLRELEPIIKKAITELIDKDSTWETYEEFTLMRQMGISSGSAGAKYLNIDGEKYRLRKRSAFSELTKEEILDWINKEPIIKSIASEKFEAGASRAIYGTDVMDYFIMAYLLNPLEKKLYKITGIQSGYTGIDEVKTVIERSDKMKKEGTECTAIDFKDFNLQHTPEAQSLLFRIVRDRLREIKACPDVIKAAKWCSDALKNQWVKFPQQNEYDKVVQGMFSGVRGTNFINTILNKCYIEKAMVDADIYLKLRSRDLHNIHQGDDVFISNGSRLWAISIMGIMQSEGFLFQSSKQIQDIQKCEFLRVIYTEDGAQGYGARTLSTYIIRPLQGEEYLDCVLRAQSMCKQLNILYRRKYNYESLEMLYNSSVLHALSSKASKQNVVRIPEQHVKYGFINNSFDIGEPDTYPFYSGKMPNKPNISMRSPRLEKGLAKNSANDWIIYMSSKYPKQFDSLAIRNRLHEMNTSDSILQIEKSRCIAALNEELREWKDRCKAHTKPSGSRNRENIHLLFSQVKKSLSVMEHIKGAFDLCSQRGISKQISPIGAIMTAIRASPFRELSLAEIGLKLKGYDLLYTVINSATNQKLRDMGLHGVFELQKILTKDEIFKLIDGTKGFGVCMESILHPNILSVINDWALENVLTKYDVKMVIKDNVLEDCIYYEQLSAIKTVYEDGRLVKLSAY